MIDTIKLERRELILGADMNIGLESIRLRTGEVLTVTATVTIFDENGGTTLAATAMTITGGGTPYNGAAYLLNTGSGATINGAGTYRAIYTVTLGSTTQKWEQLIIVKAEPF